MYVALVGTLRPDGKRMIELVSAALNLPRPPLLDQVKADTCNMPPSLLTVPLLSKIAAAHGQHRVAAAADDGAGQIDEIGFHHSKIELELGKKRDLPGVVKWSNQKKPSCPVPPAPIKQIAPKSMVRMDEFKATTFHPARPFPTGTSMEEPFEARGPSAVTSVHY